jgi:hypothetical protein
MKTPRDARALMALLLSIIVVCSLPLVLSAVAPGWWTTEKVYRYENGSVADALDYSAANQGQLKKMAIGAYEHMVKAIPASYCKVWTYPDGTASPKGVALRELVRQWVVIDYNDADGSGSGGVLREVILNPTTPPTYSISGTGPVKLASSAASHADFRAVTQGQLKAVGKVFYKRVEELYRTRDQQIQFPLPTPWRGGFPWTDDDSTQTTTDTEDDQNQALVNLGQLKAVFAFDLLADSDGDGKNDIDEIAQVTPSGGIPNNPYNPDSDGDGLSDSFEIGTNSHFSDSDLDGTSDGEDLWPNNPVATHFVPPIFYALADGNAALPDNSPVKDTSPLVYNISDDNTIHWVSIDPTVEETIVAYQEDENEIVTLSDIRTEGPTYHSFSWKSGTPATESSIANTSRNYSQYTDELNFTTRTELTQYGVSAISPNGTLLGGKYRKDWTHTLNGPGTRSETGIWGVNRGWPGDLILPSALLPPVPYPLEAGHSQPDDNANAFEDSWGLSRGVAITHITRNNVSIGICTYFAAVDDGSGGITYTHYYRPFRGTVNNWMPSQERQDDSSPKFSQPSDNGNVVVGYGNGGRNIFWDIDGSVVRIGDDLDAIAVNDQKQIVALSNTEVDLSGYKKAILVEISGTQANRKPFVDALKWSGVPAGTIDDHKRYAKQLTNIQPLFLQSIGGSTVGETYAAFTALTHDFHISASGEPIPTERGGNFIMRVEEFGEGVTTKVLKLFEIRNDELDQLILKGMNKYGGFVGELLGRPMAFVPFNLTEFEPESGFDFFIRHRPQDRLPRPWISVYGVNQFHLEQKNQPLKLSIKGAAPAPKRCLTDKNVTIVQKELVTMTADGPFNASPPEYRYDGSFRVGMPDTLLMNAMSVAAIKTLECRIVVHVITKLNDDIEGPNAIAVGNGKPNARCIVPRMGPGGSYIFHTQAAGGDDQRMTPIGAPPYITTGANGKCETQADPQDDQLIPVNKGEKNAPIGILPGPNGKMNTPPEFNLPGILNGDVYIGGVLTTGEDGLRQTVIQRLVAPQNVPTEGELKQHLDRVFLRQAGIDCVIEGYIPHTIAYDVGIQPGVINAPPGAEFPNNVFEFGSQAITGTGSTPEDAEIVAAGAYVNEPDILNVYIVPALCAKIDEKNGKFVYDSGFEGFARSTIRCPVFQTRLSLKKLLGVCAHEIAHNRMVEGGGDLNHCRFLHPATGKTIISDSNILSFHPLSQEQDDKRRLMWPKVQDVNPITDRHPGFFTKEEILRLRENSQ